MAINQNHLFEELGGIKCAIVEKNVSAERTSFLKEILECNGYTVVVIPSAPSKTAAVAAAAETATPAEALPPTFTIGVTDVMFNPTNAIFGRLLKAPNGRVITLAYWKQKESEPDDDTPYFEADSGRKD